MKLNPWRPISSCLAQMRAQETEINHLRALCGKAAAHLRTLPIQSDHKDGEMAAELEKAAGIEWPGRDT